MQEVVVTLDCQDIAAQALFWEAVLAPLEYRRAFDAPPYLSLVSTHGPTLLLQQVPESKRTKNRIHLDFRVEDLPAALRRIRGLGATTITPDMTEHGFQWAVLADPEGNEFCVFVPPVRPS